MKATARARWIAVWLWLLLIAVLAVVTLDTVINSWDFLLAACVGATWWIVPASGRDSDG